jgi:hypothetical protein
MNVDDVILKLEKELFSKKINWKLVEVGVEELGGDINRVMNDEDTILSELYTEVRSGKDAVELTKLFLKHGYDVSANDGFNGAACLSGLCWSFYDHYILHVAELLISAGADCSINVKHDDADEEEPGILRDIDWKLGYWNTGYYDSANIFEAYYQMAERALAGKEFRGIRSFRDCVGKRVTKVERLFTEEDAALSDPNDFTGSVIFWCEELPLVIPSGIVFIVDPFYREEHGECKDISESFGTIIGNKVRGLRFRSANEARINFEDGFSILFQNNYPMEENQQWFASYQVEEASVKKTTKD